MGSGFRQASSMALFKSLDLEVIRLVMPAGHRLPPHRLAGELTLQCLEGRLDVVHDGQTTSLEPGQLLYLTHGTLHALLARQDASALLTIALRPQA